MRRKQGWLCGINRARRTVRARQAWCRHNPGLENDNSTRVEHARQRVKTGQGVLKQKSPDSFSARGSLSSSPDRACTIEGGQLCGLERFSMFEEGTPCVEGKKNTRKWKYIFARRQGRPPAPYHGTCTRLVHGIPCPAPLRRPNMPGGRHEGTIQMMERIHP